MCVCILYIYTTKQFHTCRWLSSHIVSGRNQAVLKGRSHPSWLPMSHRKATLVRPIWLWTMENRYYMVLQYTEYTWYPQTPGVPGYQNPWINLINLINSTNGFWWIWGPTMSHTWEHPDPSRLLWTSSAGGWTAFRSVALHRWLPRRLRAAPNSSRKMLHRLHRIDGARLEELVDLHGTWKTKKCEECWWFLPRKICSTGSPSHFLWWKYIAETTTITNQIMQSHQTWFCSTETLFLLVPESCHFLLFSMDGFGFV